MRVMAETRDLEDDTIRIRVVAHSDFPRDQLIKQEIYQAMGEYVQASPDQAELQTMEMPLIRAWLLRHEPALREVVEDALISLNADYGGEVAFGQGYFPGTWFGMQWQSAGEYEALVVRLGDGRGRNFWCALFPQLCFANVAVREADESEDVQQGEVKARFFLWEVVRSWWQKRS